MPLNRYGKETYPMEIISVVKWTKIVHGSASVCIYVFTHKTSTVELFVVAFDVIIKFYKFKCTILI